MSRKSQRERSRLPAPDFFDLAGSDPELLNSGRIPDPQPEHTPLFRWLASVLTRVETRLRARGDTVIRNAMRYFWVLLAMFGVFLLVGPIINKPLDFDEVIASAEIDEVDWIARDAAVDYVVSRDADGAFTAHVSERFSADFRNGPEESVARTIVTEFKGHDVRFALGEVTVDGAAAKTVVDEKATTTEVRITRADGAKFSGTQEVALSYELHDLVSVDVDTATGQAVDSLNWPLFAPTWPQATKGIDVSLTLADDVNDALVRAPQAYIGWLLVSATEWLSPEADSADGVRYAFSNDDTLPPNADLYISAKFEPGTFAQPPTTALFWVQTYGPLLPLALLVVLALFAFAARRVVWADSAGEPWYLPRSERPEKMSPKLAAEFMRKPRHVEIVSALDEPQGRSLVRRTEWFRRIARAGRRAGTLGNSATIARRTASWSRTDAAVAEKLRWVPDSYVRDFFTFAPIAIMLLQWGLLRQLSHQVILSIVWWPAVFVLVSTICAILAVAAVWRPRPLTRKGALAMQQLKGIDVWARATRLLDRGPLDDRLLPYAVLFERPRKAGRKLVAHAEAESGDRAIDRGWRSEHFVSAPAVFALVVSIAALAGSIVSVSTLPPPYDNGASFITHDDDLPGSFYTEVSGFEIAAELSRSSNGQAHLDVVEQLDVNFDDSSSNVPQFAKEWPVKRLGQSIGFKLESVSIDGKPVPYSELPQPQTHSVAMLTQLSDVLAGTHAVEIRYSLTSAAVAASNGPQPVQEVRWATWLSFWDDDYYATTGDYSGGKNPVRPMRVQLTVDSELVDQWNTAGWLNYDSDRSAEPLEYGNVAKPWVTERQFYTDTPDIKDTQHYELRIGSQRKRADGALVVELDADAVTSRFIAAGESAADGKWSVDPDINSQLGKYELDLGGDVGALFEFPAGTFDGVSPVAYEKYTHQVTLPYTVMLWGFGLVLAGALGVIAYALAAKRAVSASLRTTSRATIPLLALAQTVYFCWVVMPMAGDDSRGTLGLSLIGVTVVAVIAQIVVVNRRNRAE